MCALGVTAPQALAVTPEGDIAGEFPVQATAVSGPSELVTESSTIQCTSGTGTGQATSKTTGEGSYLLHGCKGPLGVNCSSAGQPSGTIKIETVSLHLVYLDENQTTPGVLALPPESGVFAKFKCSFIASIEVTGNGVLGEIISPNCEETSSTATVVTEVDESGSPIYTQVEETGTTYGMFASVNGGEPAPAATVWEVTGTSEEESTLTCP